MILLQLLDLPALPELLALLAAELEHPLSLQAIAVRVSAQSWISLVRPLDYDKILLAIIAHKRRYILKKTQVGKIKNFRWSHHSPRPLGPRAVAND